MVDNKIKKRMIMKYADFRNKTMVGNRIIGAKVRCQGCGEWISTDDNMDDVGFSENKRHSCTFFHGRCADKVWDSKIRSDS
jgi:hypothetical protein